TVTCATQVTPVDCPNSPVFTPPLVSDACDASVDVTFSDVTTPGTCANTYSVTRKWIATDDCGNTNTCSATIVVQDVTARRYVNCDQNLVNADLISNGEFETGAVAPRTLAGASGGGGWHHGWAV